MSTKEDLILEIRAEMDQLRAALLTAAGDMRELGDQARGRLGGAFREVGEHSNNLFGRLKDLRMEARQHERTFNFVGEKLSAVGGIAKGTASELAGVGIALASGMWTTAAIEALKLVIGLFGALGKEEKAAAEEARKAGEKIAQSVEEAADRSIEARKKAAGWTDLEIKQQTTMLPLLQKRAEIEQEIADLEEKKRASSDWQDIGRMGSEIQSKQRQLTELQSQIGQMKSANAATREAEAQIEADKKAAEDKKKAGEKAKQELERQARETETKRKEELAKDERDRDQAAKKMATSRTKILRDAETLSLSEREKLNREYEENLSSLDQHDLAGRFAAEQVYTQKLTALQDKEDEERNRAIEKDRKEQAAAAEQAMRPIADAMSSNLAAMVGGTKSATEAMGDAWRSMVDYVLQELARLAVNFIFTTLLKVGATVSGIPAAGAVGAPFMAKGGPVTGGSPYLVGENGPEPFIPDGNGQIRPSGSGVGGPSTIIHWNQTIHAIDGPSVARLFTDHGSEMVKGLNRLIRNGRIS